MRTYFRGYITPANVKQGIQAYKENGLFRHLDTTQIASGSKQALHESYTNFNEILGLFPNTTYVLKETASEKHVDIIQQFVQLSHNKFSPAGLSRAVVGDPDENTVNLSFVFNDRQYETGPVNEEFWYRGLAGACQPGAG